MFYLLLFQTNIFSLLIKLHLFFVAWIASKVKAVAPVLPSGGATTSIPSAENEPVIPGGAMEIPTGNQPTTAAVRRKLTRKKIKTTKTPSGSGSSTIAGGAANEVAGANNDDADDKDDSPAGDEPTKKAIRRAIRSILTFNRL